jgi:hypothetical protein
MKIGIEGGTNWVAEYYEATVISATDYYPFGSAMAGRKYNDNSYRYGFNGQEEDPEGIMDVINSDKKLLAKYNSYQDKTKNDINIYIY